MIKVLRNDMIWYEQDVSGVLLNYNENGKMLGPHKLFCAHASLDTLIPSREYGRIHYEVGERSLC